LPGIKKVFVRSGVRFDYAMLDKDKTFFRELVKHHISGQLKVAPEHACDSVLKVMNKPPHKVYDGFCKEFYATTAACGLNQYLVPYFISSHPGCTVEMAVKLAEYLHSIHYMPKQVQDFYPTPSTLATTMYYTETDPRTGEPIFVAKDEQDKAMQRALLQYRLKVNRRLVRLALEKAGRTDLIGFGANCILKPEAVTDRPKRPTAQDAKSEQKGARPARPSQKAYGAKTFDSRGKANTRRADGKTASSAKSPSFRNGKPPRFHDSKPSGKKR
jgi:hypothetical protein